MLLLWNQTKKKRKMFEKIKREITEAMKAHDTVTTTALRTLVSDINRINDNKNEVADDSMCVHVINKTIKQRLETVDCYKKVGKTEEAKQEIKIIDLLTKYMPIPLDESEVKTMINDAIREVNGVSPKDMGKVMKIIQPKVKNRFDSKKASSMVRTALEVSKK